MHHLYAGHDPEPRRQRAAHVPVPARAGAVHGSGRRESPAAAHGEVQPGRVGHPDQRAGRDAGVRLPVPWQLHAAPGDLAAHLSDDARPDPPPARGGLARAPRDAAPSLVARPPPAAAARARARAAPLARAIALVEWSLDRRTAPNDGQRSTRSPRSSTSWSRTGWRTRRASPPGHRLPRRPAKPSGSSPS